MENKPTFKPEMAKLFFDFFLIEKALSNLFDSVYTEHQLTTKQWLVLAVATNIERPTIQNIAKMLSTSHQNVKAIALNLQKSGLAKLAHDPNDKRTTLVVGTEKLKELYAARGGRDEENMALLFGEYSEKELTDFANYMDRIQVQIENVKGHLK